MKHAIIAIVISICIGTDLAAAEIIGRVLAVDKSKNEIIVGARNAAAKVRLGDRLQIRGDKSAISISAFFPMMTVVKCRASKQQELALIVKGMPVYTCCIDGEISSEKKKYNEAMNRSLAVAVNRKDAAGVREALAAGADPNSKACLKDEEYHTFLSRSCAPALIIAAWNDSNDIMKLLVEGGADLNIKDIEGRTPLFVSILKDNMKGITYLLDAGANIEIRHNSGTTPIHTAVFSKKIEIVKLLISRNADVNTINEKKSTPLHMAADWGIVDSVKELLAAGADTEKRDTQGMTPLVKAIYSGLNESNRDEVVGLLLKAGADRTAKDSYGHDAFWYAKGKSSVERLLGSK